MNGELTDKEEKILQQVGWRKDFGHWRTCRVCHTGASAREWGWSSPNYSFYHAHCIWKSPLAKKTIVAFLANKEETCS